MFNNDSSLNRLETKIDNLSESAKHDREKLYDHIRELYEQAKNKEVKIEVINQTLVAIQKGMATQSEALSNHMEHEEKVFRQMADDMTKAIGKISDSIENNRQHYDMLLKDTASDFESKITDCRKSIISHIDKEFVTKEHALRLKEEALNRGREERIQEMETCSKSLKENINSKIANIEATIKGAKWVVSGIVVIVPVILLLASNFKFVGS